MEEDKQRREFNISLTPYNQKIVELPLYKDSYQLLQLSISTFIQSTKLLQNTLCRRAIDLEIDIIDLIVYSYKYQSERIQCLTEVQNKCFKLYTVLKLIIDNSKICQENASKFSILLEQISKQSTAWLNSQNQDFL